MIPPASQSDAQAEKTYQAQIAAQKKAEEEAAGKEQRRKRSSNSKQSEQLQF